jgi:hypothetical protein
MHVGKAQGAFLEPKGWRRGKEKNLKALFAAHGFEYRIHPYC